MWQTVPDLNSRGTVGRKQAGPGGRIRYEKPPLGSSEDSTNFSFSLNSGSLIHKGGSLIHKGGISTFKDVQNEMVFKEHCNVPKVAYSQQQPIRPYH